MYLVSEQNDETLTLGYPQYDPSMSECSVDPCLCERSSQEEILCAQYQYKG